jgi:hypothetical protein
MNNNVQTVTIRTHNINGFNHSKQFIKSSCDNDLNLIYALQEHWLKPPLKKHLGTNQLKTVHDTFDGWGNSAMKASLESGVRIGRPYGGTGFLWPKKLSLSIKPRIDIRHDRVSVLEVNDADGSILCFSIYMPYFCPAKVNEHILIYYDTIGFVKQIMSQHKDFRFIFCLDMNCNVYDSGGPFSKIMREFIDAHDLICGLDLSPNFDPCVDYTRHDAKTKSRTLIDGILLSRNLKGKVRNISIDYHPNNVSDHFPIDLEIDLSLTEFCYMRKEMPTSINWKRVVDGVKLQYESCMKTKLNGIHIPFHSILHGDHCCDDCSHIGALEGYYNNIIDVIQCADGLLPRCKPFTQRDYWNDNLSHLKKLSYDSHVLWKQCGRPKDGPIFSSKQKHHLAYKYELRNMKKQEDQSKCDDLHENLLLKEPVKFWKSWNEIHGGNGNNVTRINGHVEDRKIACEFADCFRKIYSSNDKSAESRLKGEFDSVYPGYFSEHINDSLSEYYFSWDDMMQIVSKLKMGKATSTFVKAEHIINGSPELITHLHLLFNGMLQHGYVPSDFLSGIMSPIVKDSDGDLSMTDNYRGLTLSSVFSFLYEHALMLKFGHFLYTSDLQFGFKPKHSTSHAIFVLRTCVDYFIENGSSVFVGFFDCTKGFDKVNHHGIYIKLMNRLIPLCFLRILIYWYSNLHCKCKWNNSFSADFSVNTGVKQGGVLSPQIFAVYVDDLVLELKKSGLGCHIVDLFIAAVFYADDLALCAPTRSSLQGLVDICVSYGRKWCIEYNFKKTKIVVFGKNRDTSSFSDVFLDDKKVDYVDSWKYLGVTVVSSGRFQCSSSRELASFYGAANTILNVLRKPSEVVQMSLLYTICVPIITYACEVKRLTSSDLQRLNVALNDCIRKIFTYNRWESTRFLREQLGYGNIIEIFAKREKSFLNCMSCSDNSVLTKLKLLHI